MPATDFFKNFLGRSKSQNAYQINDLPLPNFNCGWEGLITRRGERNYSSTFLWMILEQIYSGISNVSFRTARTDSPIANGICDFIDRNSTILINKYLHKGYIAIFYDYKNNRYTIPKDDQLRFDGIGRVINKDCVVIYSELYQTERGNLIDKSKPLLAMLNTLLNTLEESSHTMGTLPVISGNSIPANPKFKEELSQAMTREYGWGTDQLKYFLSQAELKIDQIDLNIKDLELKVNIDNVFSKLLNFFGVPIDLVMGNSTYDNVASARVYFYEVTVKRYAEVLLKVARNLLTASNAFIPQNSITYKITNVQGLDKTLSDTCAEKGAYIDQLLKLSQAGIDVTDELKGVYADLQKDYLEV